MPASPKSSGKWRPEDHADVRAMLTDFARALVADLPLAPPQAEA